MCRTQRQGQSSITRGRHAKYKLGTGAIWIQIEVRLERRPRWSGNRTAPSFIWPRDNRSRGLAWRRCPIIRQRNGSSIFIFWLRVFDRECIDFVEPHWNPFASLRRSRTFVSKAILAKNSIYCDRVVCFEHRKIKLRTGSPSNGRGASESF